MAKHRDQAKFDRAAWRLMVLLPCWVMQISLLLVLIGISAYIFANVMNDEVETQATATAWSSINIGFSAVSVLLTGYEIATTMTESLTPKIMMWSNLIKLFGVVLSMIMDGLVTGTDVNSWAIGTLVIHSLLVISTLVLGSYASWKWKCLADYDDYHLPGNVKPFGYKSDEKGRGLDGHARGLSEDMDWDPDLEFGNNVEIVSGSSPAQIMAPSPGEPSHGYTDAARSRGSSFSKLAGRMNFSMSNDVDETNANAQRHRANSASSRMAAETAYDPVAQQMAEDSEPAGRPRAASYISITGTGSERRASYNHTIDPSYEEYVREQKGKQRATQNRSSVSSASSSMGTVTPPTPAPTSRNATDAAAAYRLSLNLKNDVDDALTSEFGWGMASRSSMDSEMVSAQPPSTAVGGGAAPIVKRNVRDSLATAPSEGSERGSVGEVSDCSDDEADEDESEDRRKQNVDEATRALLGGGSDVDHPDLLRPGRPKSAAIAFVVTPPEPAVAVGSNPRMTWGGAYARPN